LIAILRISSATTANPRPNSPALAASIAALSPNKFEFAEISLINFRMESVFLICSNTFSPEDFINWRSSDNCKAVADSS